MERVRDVAGDDAEQRAAAAAQGHAPAGWAGSRARTLPPGFARGSPRAPARPVTRPLRIRETVVIETLAFSATSRSVTDPIAGFIPSVASVVALLTSRTILRAERKRQGLSLSLPRERRPAEGEALDDFPRFDLSGQVALVTGAARGLGRAISLALAHAGADVALGFRELDAAASARRRDRGARPPGAAAPDGRARPRPDLRCGRRRPWSTSDGSTSSSTTPASAPRTRPRTCARRTST